MPHPDSPPGPQHEHAGQKPEQLDETVLKNLLLVAMNWDTMAEPGSAQKLIADHESSSIQVQGGMEKAIRHLVTLKGITTEELVKRLGTVPVGQIQLLVGAFKQLTQSAESTEGSDAPVVEGEPTGVTPYNFDALKTRRALTDSLQDLVGRPNPHTGAMFTDEEVTSIVRAVNRYFEVDARLTEDQFDTRLHEQVRALGDSFYKKARELRDNG